LVRHPSSSLCLADHLAPEMPSTIRKAFAAFTENKSCFALPLILVKEAELQPLSPVPRKGPSLQTALNELDSILTPSNSCYIVLRRGGTLTFITYIPYRARANERTSVLENRHECVRQLGEEHFIASVICKEIGEITDVRSWEERGAEARSRHKEHGAQDAEYRKNKCRLCDRRMKNKISPEALDALKLLYAPGMTVQMVPYPDFPSSSLTY
jgi:twinfilin-like protein